MNKLFYSSISARIEKNLEDKIGNRNYNPEPIPKGERVSVNTVEMPQHLGVISELLKLKDVPYTKQPELAKLLQE
jgi:hypothetical protein